MHARARKPVKLCLLLGVLTALAGCQHLSSIRSEPDRPEDLGALMLEQEFSRAQQLLVQYPYLDAHETRTELNERISAYEDLVLSDARSRESSDDLYGANELLVIALRKLPDSDRLNEYKSRLDVERTKRLKDNERRQLLAETAYHLAQQEIYTERLNLDAPSLVQRWKFLYSQQQTHELAARLLSCGEECMEESKLELAEKCLQYARQLNDTPEVSVALSRLASARATQRINDQEEIRVVQKRNETARERKARNKTDEVLEQTQQALDDNDLAGARRIFLGLPKSRTDSNEVAATRARLNLAIQSRVKELTAEGDRQYRADRVSRAIRIWERAVELDPDNPEISERLERARKVLVRLEELKSKQRAPSRPSGQGT